MAIGLLAAPLIAGAIGLTGAGLAYPHFENRNARVRGRYRDQLLEGVNRADPMALGNALFSGGLLDPGDFTNLVNQREQIGFTRQQQEMARQQAAAARAAANAQAAATRQAEDEWLQARGVTAAELRVPSLRAAALERTTSNRVNAGFPEVGPQYDPLRDETLQRQLILGDIEAGRNQQAQAFEAQELYRDEAQPIIDQDTSINWALDNLDKATFDSPRLSDQQSLATTRTINRLLLSQRFQAQAADYGDREPPPHTQEIYAKEYPLIEPGMMDNKRKEAVRQNLMLLQQTSRLRLQDLRGDLERAGHSVPQLNSRIGVGEWTLE